VKNNVIKVLTGIPAGTGGGRNNVLPVQAMI